MAAAEEDEQLLPRLPELFDISKQLLDEVEVAAEPTGSRVVQEKVIIVIKGQDNLCELCATIVWEIKLVSNELQYLAEEVSKQIVEGANLFLFAAYSKT